ncbi:hypothetical protein SAMN00777080_3094 [Aquiflexum balticum DSM 16537]|uniref:Uncharacterized protein n=1 Tax=Aquiflexum balticum DSM 16537 TaxID=758820 RepID=A0A1W2H744_9BACT|nr:hypothetical protein SAMN00777080_3094 [Aquiflexum balticum DSM 16537]
MGKIKLSIEGYLYLLACQVGRHNIYFVPKGTKAFHIQTLSTNIWSLKGQ